MIKTGKPSLIQKKKRKIFYIKATILFLLFATVLFGFFYLYRLPGIQIKQIEIAGNKEVSKKSIETVVQRNIQGNNFFFFPKSNTIFYSRYNIEKDLLSTYKTIEKVDTSFKSWDAITVSIEERKEYGVWCDTASEAKCYSVDNKGYIYRKAVVSSGQKIFTGYFNTADVIDKYYLGKGTPEKLFSFISELEKLHVPVTKTSYTTYGDIELYYKGGGKIITNLKVPFEVTLNNFQEILRHPDFKDREQALTRMVYIDLRFGNKIFYKAKFDSTHSTTTPAN